MMKNKAQGLVEYALILALVGLAVLAVMLITGTNLSDAYSQAADTLKGEEAVSAQGIMDDFLARIQKFYDENGRYPRSWGDYRFTDIGLDPADWADSVEGIFWNPNGDKIGLGNKRGDDVQVYVTDMDGKRRHLYDGWNIWCTGGGCYYHTVAPGNEVDISTLEIVQ
jgi:Flp pilus assembly pilin Flp